MNFFAKLSYWYFSKSSLPFWAIFFIDCAIVFLSAMLTVMLNTSVVETLRVFPSFCLTLLVFLFFYVIGFRLFRTYSGIIRYSSFVDLERIGLSVLTGALLSIIANEAFMDRISVFVPIATKNIIIWSLVAMMLMWGVRVAVKMIYDSVYQRKGAKRVFIYGIKNGGISLAKSIRNQDPAKYILSGFVTDESTMKDRILMGKKVYLLDQDLPAVMKKYGARILFVSPLRSESMRENTDMVNALVDAGIKIYMVPDEQEWDGKTTLQHQQLKEVDIEDLLPRDKIEVDMKAIGELLSGKKILITGAAGSIGSEIVRQVAHYNPDELILIDQAETPLHDIRLMMARNWPDIKAPTIIADIANKARMAEIFEAHKPDYVFHAAAYKHVPMMEDNPSESIQNNVEGTRIVADLAVKHGAKKFVMISTDKAVNPTNVMGCSKRICEIYVQSLDKAIKEGKVDGVTQFVTTRFGNVLGSNGSVIPLFKEQIRKGGPLTVTHPDIIRFFMLIPEACKLVLEAGTMGNGGEIYVFDMGKPVKIVDLARRMIQLSGADIEIKFTGLRDGEKLYEEVLNDKEITLPTFHPKIKIAKVREYDYAQVNATIDGMVSGSYTDDDMTIVRHMKELVPEFKSQHSVYEALDKEIEAKAAKA